MRDTTSVFQIGAALAAVAEAERADRRAGRAYKRARDCANVPLDKLEGSFDWDHETGMLLVVPHGHCGGTPLADLPGDHEAHRIAKAFALTQRAERMTKCCQALKAAIDAAEQLEIDAKAILASGARMKRKTSAGAIRDMLTTQMRGARVLVNFYS